MRVHPRDFRVAVAVKISDHVYVDGRFEDDGLLTHPRTWYATEATSRPQPETSYSTRTLGDLSRALVEAEILDPRTIQLPGAAITLPWGMMLIRRFRSVIDELFDAAGYEEYDFPELAPEAIYRPAFEAYPLQQDLIRVGSDDDWERGKPRAVLSPTGEASVYSHWSRTVKSSTDLPIRLRRSGRYFRPVPRGARSGRGLFRPMEAPEIHEFHACVADHGAVERELQTALELMRAICDRMQVPVIWSRRPPWGNNGEIALRTFGGDTILPSGGTIQVACVYDQGQGFARAYNIRLRDRPDKASPFHVTGCVTRRLVLALLQQSIDENGRLVLHPDVSPVQVVIRGADGRAQLPLVRALRAAGISTRHEHGEPAELRRVRATWRRRGIPVQVLVQSPRGSDDPTRVLIETAHGETAYRLQRAEDASDAVVKEIRASCTLAQRRVAALTTDRVVDYDGPVRSADDVAEGRVVVVPVEPSRSAIAEMERLLGGEVIGLRRASYDSKSPTDGAMTEVRALVARRG